MLHGCAIAARIETLTRAIAVEQVDFALQRCDRGKSSIAPAIETLLLK